MNDIIRLIRRLLHPYQEFILPVGLLCVSAGVILFGIVPGAKKTYEVWGQLQSERAELADLKEKAQFLTSLDETTLFNQLSQLTAAIPVDKSVSTILSTIDGVSAKTGSIFSSLQLAAPGSLATEAAKRQTTEEAALGSYIIPFSLNFEGSYTQLRNTLDALTTSRRLLRIKNFSISFPSADLGRALLSMDTLYAPFAKPVAGKKLVPLTSGENAIISRAESLLLLSTGDQAAAAIPVVPRPDPFSP